MTTELRCANFWPVWGFRAEEDTQEEIETGRLRVEREEGVGERFHVTPLIQASIAASAYTRACLSYFKLSNSIPRETTVSFSRSLSTTGYLITRGGEVHCFIRDLVVNDTPFVDGNELRQREGPSARMYFTQKVLRVCSG